MSTQNKKKLENKVAIVTGSSSGIGRAIAIEFASENAKVVLADINERPRRGGKPTEKILKEKNYDCLFVKTDVTSEKDLNNLVSMAINYYSKIDILVNCAGIYFTKPFIEVSEEDYRRMININLKAVFLASQLVIKQMLQQKSGGCIVNISSLAGLFGRKNESIYCVSKAGVANLTRALAVEFAEENIRVNAINPGIIETSMTTEDESLVDTWVNDIPLKRIGMPYEVAKVALFLSSEDSSYITGQNIIVDGGLAAK